MLCNLRHLLCEDPDDIGGNKKLKDVLSLRMIFALESTAFVASDSGTGKGS